MLLLLSAIAQIAYGVAAISGVEALQDNVREIESSPRVGDLYLSLTGWGVLLALVGTGGLAAAWSLARRAPAGRLLGLGAALFGLGVSFFTLALFRAAAFVTMGLSLAVLYLLSYRVSD